jgi:hypothetical protein
MDWRGIDNRKYDCIVQAAGAGTRARRMAVSQTSDAGVQAVSAVLSIARSAIRR